MPGAALVNNSMHIKFQLSNIQAKSLPVAVLWVNCGLFGFRMATTPAAPAAAAAADCFVNINLSLI